MSDIKSVLGISAFYHDSALCYIKDGKVAACIQEERFSRKKHDSSFPQRSIEILRDRFGLVDSELDAVVFYDKPVLKFERIIANLVRIAPFGYSFAFKALPSWIKEKLYVTDMIRKRIKGDYKIYFLPHHISHAASAFYPSEFERAAFIVNDGVGEWESTSWGVCGKNGIEIRETVNYPHSLGMFYSAFTYFCGFKVNSGEYKLMGLAPYGKPEYYEIIKNNIISIKDDGSYRLNMRYFNYQYGERMTGKMLEKLLKVKRRDPDDEMKTEYADIAASVQKVLEDILIKMARHVREKTSEENLVMAGGVALNCVANSRIVKEAGFGSFFIQPASGDAGGAMGAALYAAENIYKMRMKNAQEFSFLGTEYSDEEIEKYLKERNLTYSHTGSPAETAASLIADGKIVGWYQGRMEYGPRALGSRSILGDPRDPGMQKRMNLKIKFRESFRPFAPSVLEEKHTEYFEEDFSTPYMLTVSVLREERRLSKEHTVHDFDVLSKGISEVPAVIHADFTSRVQTVTRESNPLYYELISEFYKKTGVPMVINTSFNVRGQPIVESPSDAVATFLNTEIDYLIIGGFVLNRTEQKVNIKEFGFNEKFDD